MTFPADRGDLPVGIGVDPIPGANPWNGSGVHRGSTGRNNYYNRYYNSGQLEDVT
jgi:hypothetical protein